MSAHTVTVAGEPVKIDTTHVYPPIPERRFDWSATLDDYDGAPDSSGPCSFIGRGPTEQAAIDDLVVQLEEEFA